MPLRPLALDVTSLHVMWCHDVSAAGEKVGSTQLSIASHVSLLCVRERKGNYSQAIVLGEGPVFFLSCCITGFLQDKLLRAELLNFCQDLSLCVKIFGKHLLKTKFL